MPPRFTFTFALPLPRRSPPPFTCSADERACRQFGNILNPTPKTAPVQIVCCTLRRAFNTTKRDVLPGLCALPIQPPVGSVGLRAPAAATELLRGSGTPTAPGRSEQQPATELRGVATALGGTRRTTRSLLRLSWVSWDKTRRFAKRLHY